MKSTKLPKYPQNLKIDRNTSETLKMTKILSKPKMTNIPSNLKNDQNIP